MKRIVPFHVRCVSLLISVGITTLIVVVHGADLQTLGAPPPADRAASATAPASESGGFQATMASPAMKEKFVGEGSQYLRSARDSHGDWLSGKGSRAGVI